MGLPVLLLVQFVIPNGIIRALIGATGYGITYYFFVRHFKIEEVELVVGKVFGITKGLRKGRAKTYGT